VSSTFVIYDHIFVIGKSGFEYLDSRNLFSTYLYLKIYKKNII
jgi:hypothetical protein